MLEAQQLLQQLQHLLPQLQSKLAVPSSAWQGEALLKAHVALLWAMCCMDQCSRASPEAKGGLLAPLIGTLPQVCMPGKAVTACVYVMTSLAQLCRKR